MKYILIILVIVITLGFLQIDEDKSSTAKEWTTKLENDRASKSEAFIYLNGIMAAENEDVMEVGESRFSAYRKAEELANPYDDEIVFDDYPNDKMLPKPHEDNEIYCPLWESDCLGIIVKNSSKWESELNDHSVILARYRKFISFSEFTTLSRPSAIEVIPNYKYIGYGNKLALLENLLLAERGSPRDAIASLSDDIYKLRKQLAVADNLIHKLVFVNLIANNLDVIAYIGNKYESYQQLNISYLTLDELSIAEPMIREFGMMNGLYTSLDGNPEIFEIGGNMPSWFVRAVFKPNMTINESIFLYERLIYMATLSQDIFPTFELPDAEEMKKDIDYLNYVGSVLNSIAFPNYHEYIARLYDLNCKISLVRYVLSDKKTQLKNPYYPDSNSYEVSETEICFNGPYEDTRRLRCISTKI